MLAGAFHFHLLQLIPVCKLDYLRLPEVLCSGRLQPSLQILGWAEKACLGQAPIA
jgi:hypothetical protein